MAVIIDGTNGINTAGNIVMTTANGGITFNNSSAIGNTQLNDYETGTWSPTLIGSISNPTLSYNNNNGGRYIKVGKMVYLSFYLRFSSLSGGSGNAYLGNLPFLCVNSTQNIGVSGVSEWSGTFPSDASRPIISLEALPNATASNILKSGPSIASANIVIGSFSSGDTYLLGGLMYETTF